MPAKRRKRKPVADNDLPNPGERQCCRLPDWWSKYSETDLQAMHAAVGSFSFVSIEQAIKNPACGGADEHLVGRLIAMISSTRVKFVLASVPS